MGAREEEGRLGVDDGVGWWRVGEDRLAGVGWGWEMDQLRREVSGGEDRGEARTRGALERRVERNLVARA